MSGQDIALIPATAVERWKYAETLADANLLPVQFRRRPADVFYAVEYGAMLGLSPIAALTGIHVIEGKPSASASLMVGLVQSAGHKVRTSLTGTVAAGDIVATCTVIRSDDPDHPYVSTWDLGRALRAELIDRLDVTPEGRTVVVQRTEKGKAGAWQKFTESMLKARAKSEATRDAAEDALWGLHYTPEELGADVDEDGAPVDVVVGEVVDTTPPAAARADADGDYAPPVGAGAGPVARQEARSASRQAATATPPRAAQPDPGPAPAGRPEPAERPDEPVGQDLAPHAAEAAKRAAVCADEEVLRATYREAGRPESTALHVPVQAHLPDPLLSAAGLPLDQPVALGRWIQACAAIVRDHGKSVTDHAAALEDPWAAQAEAEAAAHHAGQEPTP